MAATRVGPGAARGDRPQLTRDYSLLDLLRRPEATFDRVTLWASPDADTVSRETLRQEWGRHLADQAIEQIETATRYAGYIEKQGEEIDRAARADAVALPPDLDYGGVRALSYEARQVLARQRPSTLGEAARLPGITPAAISLLLVHLKKLRHRHAVAAASAELSGSTE